MLTIFQVDRQSVSIRCLVFENKSHYFWAGVYISFSTKPFESSNYDDFYYKSHHQTVQYIMITKIGVGNRYYIWLDYDFTNVRLKGRLNIDT